MSEFLELIQSLQFALKALLMYTGTHPRAQSAIAALGQRMADWLADKASLHIAASQGRLFLDGTPVEAKHLHLTALCRQLNERQISGLIIRKGVTPEELEQLLNILILKPARIDEMGGVAAVFARQTMDHIQLGQTQYREVKEGEGGAEDHDTGPAMLSRTATGDSDQEAAKALAGLAAAMAEAAAAARAAAGQDGAGGTGALDAPGRSGGMQAPGGAGGLDAFGAGGGGLDTRGAGGGANGQGSGGANGMTFDLEILTDQWEETFEQLPHQSLLDGSFQSADLGYLAGTPLSFGMGDAFPSAQQMEGLRQALLGLEPARLLAVVGGLDTLPAAHAGMRMGFQALAPEAFGRAGAALFAEDGLAAQEAVFATVRYAPQRQAMLGALEAELKNRGAGPELLSRLQDLIQQLDWENQSMEEKLRLALEHDHLWNLTLDQRLKFLRRLLDEGRIEGLLSLLEQILEALREEDVARRELAAQTLTGVTRWLVEPGLPVEAEGSIIQGLAAHFGWEPLAHIHRASTEALHVVIGAQITRGEPGQALTLLQELEGLLAFQDGRQEWRTAALAGLQAALADPGFLRKVAELLHTANAETMLGELIPYLEAVGQPASTMLVELLGEEPDRKRRGRLLETIRLMGDQALPAVHQGLESQSWYLVRNSLNLLADLGDAGGLDTARACLDHADDRVKRAAVRTLWKLGGPASVPPLVAVFPTVDPETQLEIMFALGQVRAVQAVPLLSAYAQERRHPERLRVRAADTIGQIGDPRATPVLVDLARRKGKIFTSAEPIELRLAACRALLTLGTPQAYQALCEVVAAEPWSKDRSVLQQIVNQHRAN